MCFLKLDESKCYVQVWLLYGYVGGYKGLIVTILDHLDIDQLIRSRSALLEYPLVCVFSPLPTEASPMVLLFPMCYICTAISTLLWGGLGKIEITAGLWQLIIRHLFEKHW